MKTGIVRPGVPPGRAEPKQAENSEVRDDFPQATKDLLAERVGMRCSNPGCRQPTSGPHDDPQRAVNVGVAGHITAAAQGGPRYDPTLTPQQRVAPENGIWLCAFCGRLVDTDDRRFSVAGLKKWKVIAENFARGALENRGDLTAETTTTFVKAERLMPDLLLEMRADLNVDPLKRELVLLKRNWSYWAKGNELVYYFDDHSELREKMQILSNLHLVREITHNNVDRFLLSETLVDYLVATTPLNWDQPAGGLSENVVGGTGNIPIQIGGDAHFHGPITAGSAVPAQRPFADAPHLRWLDPSATFLPDGRLVVEVYLENSGHGESVAVILRVFAEARRSDASSPWTEWHVEQPRLPAYIRSNVPPGTDNRRFRARFCSLGAELELSHREIRWSAIYKDGDLIEGFKSDASLVVDIAGNGVVRIVDDRNMDATSTKATRNQRYKSWVEEHGDPST